MTEKELLGKMQESVYWLKHDIEHAMANVHTILAQFPSPDYSSAKLLPADKSKTMSSMAKSIEEALDKALPCALFMDDILNPKRKRDEK